MSRPYTVQMVVKGVIISIGSGGDNVLLACQHVICDTLTKGGLMLKVQNTVFDTCLPSKEG